MRAVGRALAGPRDTRLPLLAIAVPALVWLGLEGRAYPPLERFQTGDYAKIELYTRLAAEGSQRVGTESRFHIHQPGPSFFYAAAPIYMLMGATTRGMAAASLGWNLLFLVALLRGVSHLAPGEGPLVAALLLAVFLGSRGLGFMASSWNPHVAMLPFALVLVASARLATGEGRALWVLVLAASVVLQSQVAWIVPVALTAGVGVLLGLSPTVRGSLGIPTRGPSLGWGVLVAAGLVACTLWALPVVDEFTSGYHNLHRILMMLQRVRSPTPWTETLEPSVQALNLRRDGFTPESAFAWGVLNPRYDYRLHPPADGTPTGRVPSAWTLPDSDVAQAALVAIVLLASGWLAARRHAPTTALAVVAAAGMAAVPIVVRYVPGRRFPSYLFMWAALVTLASLLVAGTELLARAPRLRAQRWLAGLLLLAVPALLLANGIREQRAWGSFQRDPRSVEIERLTQEIRAQVGADLPHNRRFLLRIAPHEDQFTAMGLILALDKAGLRFAVEPFGSPRVEGRFTPRGDEWAELLVGNLPATEGARRLGSPDGLSVVWQLPWRAGPTAPGH